MCSQERLLYVPVAEAIDGTPEFFLDTCHMNDAGSRKKTDAIYRYIKACVALGIKQLKFGNALSPPA